MVARGPGAVGCAHCTRLGGDIPCPVCKHLVCEACAADWSTCSEPSGRVFRLGTTARLIDVDPTGRFGIVARWWGRLKVVDLRALRWIDNPDLPTRGGKTVVPRATSDGYLVAPEFLAQASDELPAFAGIGQWAIVGVGKLSHPNPPAPVRATGVTGERYWYVTDTETVAITELHDATATVEIYEPLPKKVVEAVYVDAARGLLVSATWGEIAIHRIVDGHLVLAGHIKTTGDCLWLELHAGYLAARIKGGDMRGISVWRLHDDFSVGKVVLRIDEHVDVATLSGDGRYLATAVGARLVVRSVDSGSFEELDGHSDAVSFVKFVGDADLLVTADDDNRVIIRPRNGATYDTATLPCDLG